MIRVKIFLSKEKNRNCIRTFSTLSEYASFITRAIIQKCQNTNSINIDATSFCQDFVYITRHNTGLFGVAIPCNVYGDYDVLGSLYNLFFIEAPELATDNQECFKLKEALKIVSSKWCKK